MSDLRIFVPGRGEVDLRVWKLAEAAREYDERLTVGQNQADGNWCVFIKTARGTFPPLDLYPVLFLAHTQDAVAQIEPGELKKRLYNADTKRHGNDVLRMVNKWNDELQAQQQAKVDEGEYAAAEGLEWWNRHDNKDIGKRNIKVFPGEKRAGREGVGRYR